MANLWHEIRATACFIEEKILYETTSNIEILKY